MHVIVGFVFITSTADTGGDTVELKLEVGESVVGAGWVGGMGVCATRSVIIWHLNLGKAIIR